MFHICTIWLRRLACIYCGSNHPRRRVWIPQGTRSHLWFAKVNQRPPWYTTFSSTATVHDFFCFFGLVFIYSFGCMLGFFFLLFFPDKNIFVNVCLKLKHNVVLLAFLSPLMISLHHGIPKSCYAFTISNNKSLFGLNKSINQSV